MAERRRKPDYVHGNRTGENTEGYFKHKNEGSKEMNQNETQWDKLLKIKTTGRDDSHSDQYRYPYEPEKGGYVFIFRIKQDARQ